MAEDAGSVKLRITPDGTGFRSKLESIIKAIDAEVDVELGVDRGRLRSDVDAAVKGASAGQKIGVDMHADTAKFDAEFAAALTKARAEGARGVHVNVDVDKDTRLDNYLSSILGKLGDVANGGEAAGESLGRMGQAGGSSAAGLAASAGQMGLLVVGIAELIPLVGGLIGALGAAGGAFAGLGSVGLISMMGITDAFSALQAKQDEVATSSVDMSHQQQQAADAVVTAQQGVENAYTELGGAQRNTKAAQDALNDSYREGTRDLRDMNDQLKDAYLSTEDAAIAVARAREQLNKTNSDPNASRLDRQEADLRYRQALQRFDEQKKKTNDLSQDTARANAQGVEGTNAVKQAKDNLLAAQQREISANQQVRQSLISLRDAQYQLTHQVQQGSPATQKLNEALSKLSPNARDFVTQIWAMKGGWDEFQKSVQDKVFDGLINTLKTDLGPWIGTIRDNFLNLAGTLNTTIKDIIGDLTDTFAKMEQDGSMKAFLDGVAGAAKGLAPLLSGAVKGIMDMTAKAGPALGQFGEALGKMFGDSGSAMGSMGKQFLDAMTQLMPVFTQVFQQLAQNNSIKDIGSMLGSLILLIPPLVQAMQPLVRAFADLMRDLGPLMPLLIKMAGLSMVPFALGLQALGYVLKPLAPLFRGLSGTVGNLLDILGGGPNGKAALNRLSQEWKGLHDWFHNVFAAVPKYLSDKWNALSGMFSGMPAKIRSATKGMWDGIKDAFKAAINWIIQAWNKLSFTVPSISYKGHKIFGGQRIGVPKIHELRRDGGVLAAREPNGLLTGPGTGTSDSIIGVNEDGVPVVRVSAGETIVTERASSDPANARLMDAMNRGWSASDLLGLPGHADGGPIAGLNGYNATVTKASAAQLGRNTHEAYSFAWDLAWKWWNDWGHKDYSKNKFDDWIASSADFGARRRARMLPPLDGNFLPPVPSNVHNMGNLEGYISPWHTIFDNEWSDFKEAAKAPDEEIEGFIAARPKLAAVYNAHNVPPTNRDFTYSLLEANPQTYRDAHKRQFDVDWDNYFKTFRSSDTANFDQFKAKFPELAKRYERGDGPPRDSDNRAVMPSAYKDEDSSSTGGQDTSGGGGGDIPQLSDPQPVGEDPSSQEPAQDTDIQPPDLSQLPSDGGSIAEDRAVGFAKAQAGKPYGTEPPNSWDCSLYMSGIYASFMGLDANTRHFNTESDFDSLGFSKGSQQGAFNIGVHRGGGGPNSHMAGTMPDGTFVESSGASPIQYGGSAHGANDPQFELHWFLPSSKWNPPAATGSASVDGGGTLDPNPGENDYDSIASEGDGSLGGLSGTAGSDTTISGRIGDVAKTAVVGYVQDTLGVFGIPDELPPVVQAGLMAQSSLSGKIWDATQNKFIDDPTKPKKKSESVAGTDITTSANPYGVAVDVGAGGVEGSEGTNSNNTGAPQNIQVPTLTSTSSKDEVATAIIAEGRKRGYNNDQIVAVLADAIDESNLDPNANGGDQGIGGALGLYQQGNSYGSPDDRLNPNVAINAFYTRLDANGGKTGDIWEKVVGVQQHDGAYQGTQGDIWYMGQVKGHEPEARAYMERLNGGVTVNPTAVHDNGGWLMPGLTPIWNLTSQPEAILNPAQWSDMSTLARVAANSLAAGTLNPANGFSVNPGDLARQSATQALALQAGGSQSTNHTYSPTYHLHGDDLRNQMELAKLREKQSALAYAGSVS